MENKKLHGKTFSLRPEEAVLLNSKSLCIGKNIFSVLESLNCPNDPQQNEKKITINQPGVWERNTHHV